MNDLTDTLAPPPLVNIPEYTVSEISGAVKRALESAFGRVRVRGEVTEMRRYPSGHIYLSLKDEGGKISAVVWKSAVPRLGLAPENGMEVVATGRVSAYGDRSTYQLVIEKMEFAGAGALLARIEALRQKLLAEGLFAPERKRPIPLLPAVVGVVTSLQGAVIQDIRTTIARRFPRPILIWPVPVQGEGAAERIAAAIAGFDALRAGGAVPRPDVLIVARGGGSLEDLMEFNEECVVRAVSACRIPLISAVGHETDTTLIDHAADRRAPTPTAAAEMAVPSRAELVADMAQRVARLEGCLQRLSKEARLRLGAAAGRLPDLAGLVGAARQRLDDRGERLRNALPNLMAARRASLDCVPRGGAELRGLVQKARQALDDRGLRLRLAPPNLLAARDAALGLAGSRLVAAGQLALQAKRHRAGQATCRLTDAPLRAALREARARLEGLSARLESVSHDAVLARGYALVFDAAGCSLASAAAIRPGQKLRLRFADGETRVVAEGGGASRQGRLDL